MPTQRSSLFEALMKMQAQGSSMPSPWRPQSDFSGVLSPGNIANLFDRKVLNNPDGTYSTTSSMSVGIDGREVLIPTVVNGKRLTPEQAIEHYRKTGENLGAFDTPENADTYASSLHEAQAANPPNANVMQALLRMRQ